MVMPNTISRAFRSCWALSEQSWEYIRVERMAGGHILWVTIDRPEVRNALHPPASAELGRAWDLLEADADIRVGALTGAGERAFCAGFDLKWAHANPQPLDQRNVILQGGFGGLTSRRVHKPIIAAVNGAAMGGGLELALACDLIVAADTARFGLPEVAVGLVANAGGVQRLMRQVPSKRALRLILTAESISAQEAFDIGMVTQIVPPDRLIDSARALAERIASLPPLAVLAAKEVADLSQSLPLAEALQFQYPAIDRLFAARNRGD
jgi:enoyl-CoA hydratase/carnithine racemase